MFDSRRQRLDPDEQRTRILSAAATSLAAHGFDGVRLRDIARTAGVSVGLVQHYFDTREALLLEVFERECSDLLAAWADATGCGDPWTRIQTLIDRLTDLPAFDEHCRLWTEFGAVAARNATMREGFARIHRAWRDIVGGAVREGIASDVFRPQLAPDEIVDLLLSAIDGCEAAVAAAVGTIDAQRLRTIVLRTAAALLGVTDASGEEV